MSMRSSSSRKSQKVTGLVVDKELEPYPVEHQESQGDRKELGHQQTIVAQGRG